MKTKRVRNYYEEIDKALYSHEYCKPWHDKPMEWIANRIDWCWKFRHIIETMIRNMLADLDAGYDFHGGGIGTQLQYVEEYYEDFRNKLKEFKDMRELDINKWCYKDMIERGAMEEIERGI